MNRLILASLVAALGLFGTSAIASEYNLTIDRQDVDIGGRTDRRSPSTVSFPAPHSTSKRART